MPGQVQLPHAGSRQRVDERVRVEAVVHGAHIYVVDVEQQIAVGALCETREKFRFAHLRRCEPDVARDVLEQDAATEHVLHSLHTLRNVRERVLGVRQRQQVVQIDSVDTRPAEVIGDPGGLDALAQAAQLRKVSGVERIAAADRERDAVQHDRITLADALEVV
jgi:hypothetical protein